MIAFVLSGGASLGAIQVGMLRALYERNIAPELIVGTSAGAVNGAFIASRPPVPATAEELAQVWESLRTLKVFPPNPLTAVLALLDQRDHFVSNDGVRKQLSKYEQFKLIEDAPISLHVIATDVLTGAERRISSGDAKAAVLASAAIPGVYPAIEFEGEYLIDGGVCDNTPISAAAELGATVIYVLPAGHACALKSSPRGAIPMIVHAVSLLINQRLASDIERFSHQAKLIVLPPPCPVGVTPSDFDHAAELIQRGYESAKQALDDPDPSSWTPKSLALLSPHAH